jgi:hypothetical protein
MTILEEIQAERKRQDEKWGEQNHPFVPPNLSNDDVIDYVNNSIMARDFCDQEFSAGRGTWNEILNEEYHEAFAEAALGNVKEFREELIQVAAVVVAMIECLDRKEGK